MAIYIAIGWHVWGRGDSAEKAVANLKKEDRKCRTYIVREYPDGCNPRVSGVDGSVEYDNGFGVSREVCRVRNGKKVTA